MGGTVAVTLRKPDGTEYRMNRWTNSMPWGITNMKLLRHDMKHVDAYLEQWISMRDDYERGKESGVFEHEMTDCYFPSDGLAPCGYGLVVIDMVNDVILTMQDYTSFDSMCAASIQLEHSGNVIGTAPADPDSHTACFKEFFDAGQVTGMMTRESIENVDLHEDRYRGYGPVTGTYEEIMDKLLNDDDREIFDFKLDMKPFTIEVYEDYDSAELIKMRDRVLELGFVITDEENKVWDETIKEAGE